MTIENILEIVKVGGYILLGALALYFKASAQIRGQAAAAIADAEHTYKDVTKAGGMKFEYAVDRLHGVLPAWLKPLISRDTVGYVVQTVFDGVEAYAKTQLDKAVGKK